MFTRSTRWLRDTMTPITLALLTVSSHFWSIRLFVHLFFPFCNKHACLLSPNLGDIWTLPQLQLSMSIPLSCGYTVVLCKFDPWKWFIHHLLIGCRVKMRLYLWNCSIGTGSANRHVNVSRKSQYDGDNSNTLPPDRIHPRNPSTGPVHPSSSQQKTTTSLCFS
jgi:hypothetical protein